MKIYITSKAGPGKGKSGLYPGPTKENIICLMKIFMKICAPIMFNIGLLSTKLGHNTHITYNVYRSQTCIIIAILYYGVHN